MSKDRSYRPEGHRTFLGRVWSAFWRLRGAAATRRDDESDGGWAGARGRFWTEFRAGQREAEARSGRPR
jgi:hypothetical protein